MGRQFIHLGLLMAMAMLAAPAVAQGQRWVDANHLSLRYELVGDGKETLVLLQESGLPYEIWDEILPALVSRKRTVLRYDPRGTGLSEKVRTPFTMDDEVADLKALLDVLQVRRPVVLFGGALGGSIALSYAARYPEEVRGVVVTSPSALLQARAARPWVDPARDPSAAAAREEQTLKVIYPPTLRSDERRWQRFLGLFHSGDPDSVRLTEQIINTTPYADVLPAIRCPVLLVATARFPRPVESVRELTQQIPQGRMAVLDTGHLASWQSPELVAPLVLDFLTKLPH